MTKTGKKINGKQKLTPSDIVVHIILVILSVIWVIPILWIVLISFRGEKGQYVSTLLPKAYTLGNYTKLFTDTGILNFPKMFMNTLIIAIFSCIISTVFVLAMSYCMSRMRFRLRRPFMNVALILGMFPGFMAMIAVYYILKAIGLSEGSLIRVALILVYSGGAGLQFYIAKGFFDTIPKSIEEAAYLDGATRWQKVRYISWPLLHNVVCTCAVLAVTGALKVFDLPWVMFPNGAPLGKTWLTGTYMYYKTMQAPYIDYSSAIAFFIVILGVILSKVVNKIFKERDY